MPTFKFIRDNDRYTAPHAGAFHYSSSSGSSLIKEGPGILQRVLIGGGTLGTVTLYDSSGPLTNPILQLDATTPRGSYDIAAAFTAGLVVDKGAATLLTVIYT